MRIYADFNAIEVCKSDSNKLCMGLTGYGTLASLNFHNVKLHEGMFLKFFDSDGTLTEGVITFHKEKIAGNCSGWFVEFPEVNISYVEDNPADDDPFVFLCFKCRRDIAFHFDAVGRHYNESCPFCSTSVMFALSPPQ